LLLFICDKVGGDKHAQILKHIEPNLYQLLIEFVLQSFVGGLPLNLPLTYSPHAVFIRLFRIRDIEEVFLYLCLIYVLDFLLYLLDKAPYVFKDARKLRHKCAFFHDTKHFEKGCVGQESDLVVEEGLGVDDVRHFILVWLRVLDVDATIVVQVITAKCLFLHLAILKIA